MEKQWIYICIQIAREITHQIRVFTVNISIYSAVRKYYSNMLWYIGKSCKLSPEPIDITNYTYSVNELNELINEAIESLAEDELDGMQQVVTHWLNLQGTNSKAPLRSLRQGGYIDHCKEWVNCILDKYPPEINRILLGILRHNIDAQTFLNYQRNNNLCMSLLVIDSKVDDAEHRISVPGQITPKSI